MALGTVLSTPFETFANARKPARMGFHKEFHPQNS
jgi:hypothetical protein